MKHEINAVMSSPIDDNLNFVSSGSTTYVGDPIDTSVTATTTAGWTWWRDEYYPKVIRESYPVYVQERAQDKGKQAFEIIKMLKDKRFINLDKVGDFVDMMDELIKIL